MLEEIKAGEEGKEGTEGKEAKPGEGEAETPEQIAEREAAEAEEAEAAKAAKEKEERSFDRMQARIDELTAKLKEQEAKIEAKGDDGKAKPKYTENDLYAIMADPEQVQYHAFAVKELIRMGIEGYDQKLRGTMQVSDAVRASAQRAMEEFPDLADNKSEHWKLANRIFIENDLAKNPNGTYLAAKMAAQELAAGKGETKEQLERKLARLQKKTSLAGGEQKAKASPNAEYEKIRKAALAAGPNTGAWNAWMKAQVAQNAKKP